ncbi:hypothetical protein [Paenibacillus sp. L3-i20]|uniref:hypothetical protein n=1 Tax=Paenibacillus sp. L3-i20 TaxID=2905833 RepID=UPI001EDD5DF0|nr:hypothetical protein [Paenibacillus sp. L3-i20]GKU77460.1 hypothetical protein L3i20_v218570 [Paenibacillus sp. L3-i20]
MKKNAFGYLIFAVFCINIVDIPYTLLTSDEIPYLSIIIVVVLLVSAVSHKRANLKTLD